MSIRARRLFWSRTKALTLALLGIWLLVNLAVPWFARDLDGLRAFGFPLGYWMTAEGTLLTYLLLIVAYVVSMERLELAYLEESELSAREAGVEPP